MSIRTEDRSIKTRHGVVSIRENVSDELAVVLIHGNSCSKDVFVKQFESALAQDFHLLAIDLPGHGASENASNPTETYSFRGYADAVLEVLELMDVNQAAVFGWSLGGHVALEMMASSPDVVGVMLSGTPPIGRNVDSILAAFRPHPDQWLIGQADLNADEVRRLQRLISGSNADEKLAAALRRTDGRARELMIASCLAGDFADQRSLVETLPTPVAVVNGAEDPIVNTDYVASLAYADLWEGRCILLPGVGHMPFAETPELFNSLLGRFLRHVQGRMLEAHPPLSLSA